MTDNTVTLPLIELGRLITYVPSKTQELDELAKEVVQREIDDLNKVLSYITDVRVVEEISSIIGPNVDMLRRFKPIGYHGIIASQGYDLLSKHFACHQPHVSAEFDWNLVKKTAKMWFRYNKYNMKKWRKKNANV